MDFRTLLKTKEFVIFDGAMGTMLQAAGLQLGHIPEELNFTEAELLENIHRQYAQAGADLVYTNTFGANRYKLSRSNYSVEEVVKKGIANARKGVEGTDTLVALDIGPIGQMLEPTGTLTFEEAYDIFKEIILAGEEADLIVFETMTDLAEAKAAILAAKENSAKPIVCTMTFEENHRTFTGVSLSAMAMTIEGLGVDALGMNCSLGPEELEPIVKELSKWTNTPIVVKPNAGLPDPLTNEYSVGPKEFSQYMKKMIPYGIKAFGGCCGTTPDFIRELKRMLDQEKYVPVKKQLSSMICSSTKALLIDGPRIIGERINPTGKKLFKQALMDHDMGYILKQAIEQVNGGAEILDVNVGLPGIDEKEMMVEAIKEIQAVTDVPLQIDSTIPEVLEAALRVYNGKPIVNSVNGEKKSMDHVLPLVKKYGAAVVALTLDENGIPKKAQDRFAIAERILKEAEKYGIPKENIFVDCLTLTVSAEQEGALETLKAIRMVKEKLGLRTVLGVSNISFGLPNRELINQNFLAMALMSGLDLPIMNPNVFSMTAAVRSYRVLANIDRDSREYIQNYSGVSMNTNVTGGQNGQADKQIQIENKFSKEGLFYAIDNGLKEEGNEITKKLLESTDPMVIVNEMLIPALDQVGAKFEKGTIFLPQLILSADVAKEGFSVIKEFLNKTNGTQESKGKIVIATVKGDIHDIGKNIVKVLLENYGYTVIDLGKDVPYEEVLKATVEHGAKLVGLSALMTTTLVSMEKTIQLLHDNHVDCKIMVGGAVLTPEYAKEIGADFYAKDAKESVDIAKRVLG